MQKKGNYANNCPEESKVDDEEQEGMMSVHMGVQLEQLVSEGMLKPSWILLDSCSTDSCTNNRSMMESLEDCKKGERLVLSTNGGRVHFAKRGVFKMLPMKIYYNEKSMGTILSIKDVLNVKGTRIVYDTDNARIMYLMYKG